jgi:putative membrane protein
MSVFQIFWAGVKSNFSSVVRVITLVCIAIVPVLYPLFYLQAFWDPYGNLDNLPVAMVNLDAGTADANLGDNLVASLVDNHDVQWHFVDLTTADAGLADMTYYAEFIIPADFTSTLEAAKSGQPQAATIELFTNSKNSFMSSLLAQQIETRIQKTVSDQVASTYLGALFGTLGEGSAKLAAGVSALDPQGSAPLTKGAQVLAAQIQALNDGSTTAFVTNPLKSAVTDTNPVPNYGTGFAPYFLSLSGWIGALLITMTIGNRVRRVPTKAGVAATVIGRYLACAAVGVIQAVLLVGVIALLGIQPHSWPGLFGILLVSSLTSVAIVSTLVSLLGRLGQLCAMIILVFQLTGSGGTFPTPLTNGSLFSDIHPYVSFTYSIRAFREVISAQTIDTGRVWGSVGVLAVYIVGALALCIVLTTLLSTIKKHILAPHAAIPDARSVTDGDDGIGDQPHASDTHNESSSHA